MTKKTIELPKPTQDQQEYLEKIAQQGYMSPEKIKASPATIGPFDPDFGPKNPTNRLAAQQRNWRYDGGDLFALS